MLIMIDEDGLFVFKNVLVGSIQLNISMEKIGKLIDELHYFEWPSCPECR